MSLVPKLDELRILTSAQSFDLGFITETWLRESVCDTHATLFDYHLVRRDRSLGIHGGVCMYIKNSIRFKRLPEIEHSDFEVLWTHIRPPRLPRGINGIVSACVYHPPSSSNTDLFQYLSDSLILLESLFPGCGIIIAGDFNHFDTKDLCRDFQLKQLVDKPTRGAKILDLILTNMHKFYDVQPAIVFPPFGLSDHNVIIVEPKVKTSSEIPSRKTVIKRDIRQSRKKELGRYLSNFDWQMIDSSEPCDKNCDILCSAIKTGYDILMPEKHVKFHRNDNPWITEKLKQLIKFRQRAFSSNNTTLFKLYRNEVNRMRKSCRADYFASKVANLKKSNPKSWWTEVKRISGMRPVSGSLLNQLHVEDTEHLKHTKVLQI